VDPETGEVYRTMPKWLYREMTKFAPLQSIAKLGGSAYRPNIFQLLLEEDKGGLNVFQQEALQAIQDFWLEVFSRAGVRIKRHEETRAFQSSLWEIFRTIEGLAKGRRVTIDITSFADVDEETKERLENLQVIEGLFRDLGLITEQAAQSGSMPQGE